MARDDEESVKTVRWHRWGSTVKARGWVAVVGDFTGFRVDSEILGWFISLEGWLAKAAKAKGYIYKTS